MGLFRKKPASAEGTDDALTFFSRSQANEFRAFAREVFAELGLEVAVRPDHAVDDAGRRFGFWNVAAQCVEAPPAAWRGIIRDHLQRVLTRMDAGNPFETLDPGEAGARTYARLYEAESLPSAERFPHQEFAPGIVEMLALDLPDTLAIFDHEHTRSLGGFARLREHGLNNLYALPVERLETITAPGGATFTALLGDSVHTGSRALLLPRLIGQATGEEVGRFGWLMSIPNRHQVTWHVIRDATVIGAVEGMARFTALGYGDAPGPVSPHVFWWNGAAYEQLTHLDGGTLSVDVSPGFETVLDAVATAD